MQSNKKKLQDLLDKIQEIKSTAIGKISILSGYSSENYLSERMSAGSVSDKVVKRVTALLEKAKKDPRILNDGPINKKIKWEVNEDDPEYFTKTQLENEYLKKRVEDLERLNAAKDLIITTLKNESHTPLKKAWER
ncbi:MAG TPA: hypothetical protein VIM07_15090 [Chitinophagaceae bacterium]